MYTYTHIQMLATIDTVDNLYRHVKHLGVDRALLTIYNTDNYLADLTGLRYPAATAVSTIGDPHSALSRATIVALEGLLSSFWHGVATVFSKIGEILGKVWKAIFQSSGSYSSACSKMIKKVDSLFESITDSAYTEIVSAKGHVKFTTIEGHKKINAALATKVKALHEYVEGKPIEPTGASVSKRKAELEALKKKFYTDKNENSIKEYIPKGDEQGSLADLAPNLSEARSYKDSLEELNRGYEAIDQMLPDIEKKFNGYVDMFQADAKKNMANAATQADANRQKYAKEMLEIARGFLKLSILVSKGYKTTRNILRRDLTTLHNILATKVKKKTEGTESIDMLAFVQGRIK